MIGRSHQILPSRRRVKEAIVSSGSAVAGGRRNGSPSIASFPLNERADVPKKRKAPAKKPPGEKVPRAKKIKDKEKDKAKVAEDSALEDVPQVIAQ